LRPTAASARGAIGRSAAFGLAALLIVSALGYWGVATYRKVQMHKAVSVLVRDSSERLTAALVLEIEAVTRLDEHAQEVDRHVIELREMSASPDRALAAAAEEYLLTARQILREHMRAAGRRSAGWIAEAVRAKDRVEKSYFDYRVSSGALERLLASYPSARKKMSAQLAGVSLLADESVEAARKRTLASSKRVAANLEQARQLAAVH
jgi:hypothetical protein